MVKLKLNPFTDNIREFSRYEDERISDIFSRVCKEVGITEDQRDYFKIYIGGDELDKEFWAYTKPRHDAQVLIVLIPKSGDVGRALGSIAVAVATIYTGGAFGAYWGLAVAVAGNLLVSQLFPPPSLDLGGSGLNRNPEASQMYSISGQSNQTKKYGTVPKVYGEHRIYPNVVANSYTEFEVNKDTGELSQYLYALYDLGYGPNIVTDIKIGDSDIEFFNEVYYRLVDFNKPASSEGIWDDELNSTLEFYKGDNNTESINVNISANENDPGVVESEYRATRNADENPDDNKQEVILDFGFPRGLTTLATNGNSQPRTIEVDVQFAEVGTEDWKAFNDESVVDSFMAIGDSVTGDTRRIDFAFIDRSNGSQRYFSRFDVLSVKNIPYYAVHKYPLPSGWAGNYDNPLSASEDRYGFKAGQKFFYTTTAINENAFIRYGNEIVGKVKTKTDIGGGVFKNELYVGFPYDIFVFRDFTRYDSGYQSYYIDTLGEAEPQIREDLFEIEGNTAGIFKITGNNSSSIFASVRFVPKTSDQIKVRVTRVRSYGGATFRINDAMTWQTLTTRLDVSPINTNQRHTFLEVKIKATDQLNGRIQNLSAICQSVLDVYDSNTDTWAKEVTSNPAWIFADIITGKINKRAIDKSRLDTNSLLDWASFCDEVPTAPPGATYQLPRFEANFLADTTTTVAQLVQQLTSSCQASLNIINGKYGVLVDKLKTVPVQMFTPRNTRNFSSTRTYAELPDAIKVKYVDPGREWGVFEEVVYKDGEDESTALTFEEVDTFGCTNFEQAWRTGRYFQASAILRQENITFEADFEYLVCTRGDYVLFQHDVMKVGGTPARVKTVSGADITIDDSFITEPLVNYGYTFRSQDGLMKTGTMTITGTHEATLDNDLPQAGDLFLWGEVDKITFDCIVKSIEPSDDLSARVVLMEKADGVYEAESASTLPVYDPQLVDNINEDTDPPSSITDLAVDDSSYRCGDGNYIYFINLTWTAPTGAIVDTYEVYVDKGLGNELVGFPTTPGFEYIVTEGDLGKEHKFKVLGVASNGSKINLADAVEVTDTPLAKTSPPSSIEALYINILAETLSLDWDLVTDCDIENYFIRYSPRVANVTWSTSIPLVDVDKNTSTTSIQARVGTYLIKAVDWAGNESETEALAVTSIPELFNLNVIEETNDFPDLLGSYDQVQNFGPGNLLLQEAVSGIPGVIEYYSEGYYYYEDLLDLGEIYTVRLQSLIEAEGFTTSDLMVNWPTLTDVPLLATTSVSDWNVETQYRATDEFNVIGEWPDMASIDPISEGVQSAFTSWRKFTIGDFTGRVFQFRLKLSSNNPSVTPRVFDGVIKSDMPDRTESYDNIVATSGDASVVYLPPFKGPGATPAIQITQDGASQGDYFTLSNKTLSGFDIEFFDKNDVKVTRQFDVLVKGFGRKQNAVI